MVPVLFEINFFKKFFCRWLHCTSFFWGGVFSEVHPSHPRTVWFSSAIVTTGASQPFLSWTDDLPTAECCGQWHGIACSHSGMHSGQMRVVRWRTRWLLTFKSHSRDRPHESQVVIAVRNSEWPSKLFSVDARKVFVVGQSSVLQTAGEVSRISSHRTFHA